MIAIVALPLAYLVLLSLLVYRFVRTSDRQRWTRLGLLIFFIIVGANVFSYEGVPDIEIIELIVGMLIFNGMLDTYGSSLNLIYILFGVLYVLGSYVIGLEFIAQAMLLGMVNEVLLMKSLREKVGDRRIEMRRDALQITAGLVIILLFFLLRTQLAETILISLIILGILILNLARMKKANPVSRAIYSLERRNTAIGLGALWLAMGSLITLSFLRMPYIVVVLAALFVGDSAATITGLTVGGTKLPYNRRKSVSGTTVYFLATFVIAYFAIGWLALPLALVAAFVESIPMKLDDNFTVSLVLVSLCLLIASP